MLNYSLIIFVLITLAFIKYGVCRAFGQRVEYRYEYDPKRDNHPRVQVTFDDVTDESELMRIFNQRKPIEVRKSPSRYEYPTQRTSFFEDEQSRFMPRFDDIHRENTQAGWTNIPMTQSQLWHRGFENLPVEKLAENNAHTDISEHMASFLRRHSESILSNHFPSIPRSRFSDPPNFKFMTPPYMSKFYY